MRPALSAVKVFVVVASARSFTQAGEFLNITQGAVSQQIAKLEHNLGVKLFNREGRQLSLTNHGRKLYRGVSQSLERIEAELDAVLTHKDEQVLSISTFGSVAAQWLMPRIGEFERLHPQVRLHIDTTLRLVNLLEEGVELALRFGDGEWPGLQSEKVLQHRIYAVASAKYVQTLKLESPGDLTELPLYYDLESPTEWSRWFAQAGVPRRELKLTRGFSDTLVMLSALRTGLEGVALISDHLTQSELQDGSLVRLFDDYIEPEGAYYVVYPRHLPLSASAALFRDWLVAGLG